MIALSIPPECFEDVPQMWYLPDGADWYIHNWKKQIDNMLEIIHIRKRLLEEIQ